MGVIKDLGRVFLRSFKTDGLPSSGANEPSKLEGIATFDKIDELVTSIAAVQGGGALSYPTLAALNADTTDRAQYQKAEVVNDPTLTNNGTYHNTSTTATNTWVKIAEPPGTNNVGVNTYPLG